MTSIGFINPLFQGLIIDIYISFTFTDSPNVGWVILISLILNSFYKSTTEVSSLIITLLIIIISANDILDLYMAWLQFSALIWNNFS